MTHSSDTVGDQFVEHLTEALRASLRRGVSAFELGRLDAWTSLEAVSQRAQGARPEAQGAVVLDLLREAAALVGTDADVRAVRLILGLDPVSSSERLTRRRERAAEVLGSTPDSFRKHHERRLLRALASRALELGTRTSDTVGNRSTGVGARDVFICHAHVDKEGVARPLAAALAREGVSCWVDEAQILPGDSLFKAINAGLSGARQVVVLLTDAFLGRAWTERELEAATSLELDAGETLVVPVLAVPRNTLVERYPLLTGKLAIDWEDGPEKIAERLAQRFERHPARDWVVDHPKDYVGQIWTRVTPSPDHWETSHAVTLRWGPFIWRGQFTPSTDPVSLVHHKERPDQVPLHIEVDPPAIVTVGQGRAPDATVHGIDEGWTRAAGWAFSIEERQQQRGSYERNAERARWLERLRQEYVLTHDGIPPGILGGTELPPREWLRRRAEELGVMDLIDEVG